MVTELNILLAALCFACIRTDYVWRGPLLGLSIVFWGLARFLTELNFGRAQYDPLYTYGTMISYGADFCLVACLLALSAACWQPRRKAPLAPSLPPTLAQAEEPSGDPSERLRELLDQDR